MEANVSLEQLVHLLEVGHESEQLDFKRVCDLGDAKAAMEIAKDVAAMQVAGGHLVIGADDNGTPVPPGVPSSQRQFFDEANLRPKLAKWLPEPFELHSAIHTIGDCTFALIYVSPNSDGFCIVKADGKYRDGNREHFVFRRGDVFARHGTSSERWQQSDIARIRRNMASSLKEAWRSELTEELGQLGIARGAQRLVEGPAASFTWRLDTPTFDSATLELFRRNDDIVLQRFLNEAVGDVVSLVDEGQWDDVATLIGRVASVAAQALTYRRSEWFDRGLDAMYSIYGVGFDGTGNPRNDGKAEDLWLVLVEHLLGLGALAVRQGAWTAVRSITVRPPGDAGEYYPTWLRHGLTMAVRANKLGSGQNNKSLITLGVERVAAMPALRPDAGIDDDRVITSICQFDILAAITIIGATNSLSTSGWYTNFARFYTSRTEPIVKRLIDEPEMRAVLFPLSDDDLAGALREIDRMATNEGARYSGWHGFNSRTVQELLEEHPPRD